MIGLLVGLLALLASHRNATGMGEGGRPALRGFSGVRRTDLPGGPAGYWGRRRRPTAGQLPAHRQQLQRQTATRQGGNDMTRPYPAGEGESLSRPATQRAQKLRPAKQISRWNTVPAFSHQVHTTRAEALRCLKPFRKTVSSRMGGIGGGPKWDHQARRVHSFTDAFITPIFRPRNMIGCLVQKAGSSRWMLLFLHAAGYDFGPGGVRAPRAIHTNSFPGSQMDGGETRMYLADPDTPRFMIVRSPYSRFLSAYLDKILASAASQRQFLRQLRLGQRSFGRNLTKKVEDFEDFTTKLYQRIPYLAPTRELGACQINNHFAPQSCLCGLPGGFQYDYIFKLEEQAAWYPGLIKLAGLDHYVKRGWGLDPSDVWTLKHVPGILSKSDDCFWRGPGQSCQDMEEQMRAPCRSGNAQETTSGIRNASRLRRRAAGLRHSTGADGKVAMYYRSAETVRMVNEIFRKDFELFNYEIM